MEYVDPIMPIGCMECNFEIKQFPYFFEELNFIPLKILQITSEKNKY